MAFLPRPVTRMIFETPEATASSTPYWMIGLSTMGSISFGCALVAGRKRVPRPAAGKTALRTLASINYQFGAAGGDWQLTNCVSPSAVLCIGTWEKKANGLRNR